jgi:hypothetical protein
MLADRQPKPDVVSSVRRLSISSAPDAQRPAQNRARIESPRAGREIPSLPPTPAPAQPTSASGAVAPASRPPEPLGEGRYSIRFTADPEFHAQLQELKALMRHQIPDGDVGKILAKAVAVLLKQVRARKFGERSVPRTARRERAARVERGKPVERIGAVERIEPAERAEPAERIEPAERAEPAATSSPSRQIPAAIRRAVSKRDGERCAFVSATGRRCGSRDFLEFHHRRPWARHRSHAIDGITLRCRAHNQYQAERDFGVTQMQRFRGRGQSQTAGSPPETSVSSSEAAARTPETAASLAKPRPVAALQPELDLNPVGVT